MTTAKDLSKVAPTSPRVRTGGYAILARMADKGRADIAGTVGEYHFNCPLDNYSSSRYSRNFHWTLTSKPTFSMSKDPYGSSPWRIPTQTPGKATVSYERDSSYGFGTAEWKPATDTTSVSMSANVSIEDGKVKLTYSRY